RELGDDAAEGDPTDVAHVGEPQVMVGSGGDGVGITAEGQRECDDRPVRGDAADLVADPACVPEVAARAGGGGGGVHAGDGECGDLPWLQGEGHNVDDEGHREAVEGSVGQDGGKLVLAGKPGVGGVSERSVPVGGERYLPVGRRSVWLEGEWQA